MTYYVILYVNCEGGKHIMHVVDSEDAAKQFCKDMDELSDGHAYSRYVYMSREQFLDELKRKHI